MALGAERQISDLTEVHERQERIGYPSELIVGEQRGARVHDARCSRTGARRASHVCLHEQKGGFANNMASLHGPGREGA